MVLRRLFSGSVPHVSPEEALQLQREGALIVDVREPEEWRAGHIPGAVHVPLGALPARLGDFAPETEMILVCRSGSRSAQATAYLRRQGFERAYNLRGGLLAWAQRGLPLT